MRFFDRYKGFPRRIKFFYTINNLLNIKHLKHNKERYSAAGLHRQVWQPLRHSMLQNLDPPKTEHPVDIPRPAELTDDLVRSWENNGMLVLKGFFEDFVHSLNAELDYLLKSGKVGFNFTGNKICFANRESNLIRSVERDSKLTQILSWLLGREVVPFQTINFYSGSEQKAHSDSIHMSTWPEGNLIATWVALDEAGSDNGPVFYYPGSHKWPYIYNEDIGLNENALLLDANPNAKYERALEQYIKSQSIEPEVFTANPGDVLIWHANLVHGGSPHKDKSKTRRSMVMHYFGKDVICYHELTQRPAIVK